MVDEQMNTTKNIFNMESEGELADKPVMQEQIDGFRQIHKLEALGMLAGGISHDFNNLLTVIMGCTELAIMDVRQPSEAIKHLEQIKKASERARELVQQILMFSRKTKQEFKPVHLQSVIKESLDLMRHTLPATIEIIEQINPAAPMVMADATQIYQIMINLCTNAAHAMRQRPGRLTVSLDICETGTLPSGIISSQSQHRLVRISISDTGHGMNEETCAHIFEPFFTTKKSGEGTGLGLAVVHGIVREHKGHILAKSQLDVGTSIEIYLPVLDNAQPVTQNQPDLLPQGNSEHILLVDDDTAVCVSHHLLLTRLGYRVTAKTDPIDALNTFSENPDDFDLLISDLTMPRMTGVDLIEKILVIRPELPTILASGSSGASNDPAWLFGEGNLLSKPASMATLAKVVHKALSGHSAI